MPKQKKCKVCGESFNQKNSLQTICSYQCYVKFTSKKEVDKRIKEMKRNLQKLSDIEAIAKRVFQKWVRLRDEGRGCVSCGGQINDGGHYYEAGKYSGLIFDEDNVHGQCRHCNRFLSGNLIEYRKGLIKRYGMDFIFNLEEKSDKFRDKKYTREELEEIIKEYKERIKCLTK
jgi:hypothetical protein